jgi:hypothetical protein
MIKVLGNKLFSDHPIVVEVYEEDDEGTYEIEVIGKKARYNFVRSTKILNGILSENTLRNMKLINCEIIKMDIEKCGIVTIMVST